MYAEFFGLRELPFNNTPDPRFFYSTPDHEEALASLIYAVKEKKGFVLLTGEVGAGKTLVSRLMIKHFGSTISFANINHAIRDSGDLIESLCTEFELPFSREDSNAQRVRVLHDFLLARFAQNVPVVLVLDEAQNLAVDAFEQLRMIGNLEADDAKLLQIVIVGQPELQTLFQSAMLRQLRQRLFRSFHLPALDLANVDGYIRHRLTVAGAGHPGLFGTEGAAAIHRVSRGLPRLINTLCDNVMLSAYSAGKKTFDIRFVESILESFGLCETSQSRPAAALRVAPQKLVTPTPGVGAGPPQTAGFDRVGERAQAVLSQLESAIQRGSQIIHDIGKGADRAAQLQDRLAQRESQLGSLVQAVKTSAVQLAPMLADLQRATRSGNAVVIEVQEATHQLDLLNTKSQALVARFEDKVHQARLAAISAPAVHRTPDHPPLNAPRTSGPPPCPNVPNTLSKSISRIVAAKETTAKAVPVIAPDFEEPTSGQPHPALRLAQRMESLAALVQDAVAACASKP